MKVSDLTVEVRDKDLRRLGVIRPEVLDLSVTDKHNNVGSWSLKLAVEHPLADALRTPGAGIIVTGPEDVLFSGPVTTPAFKADSEDLNGTLTIAGVTDTVVLADTLAWPEPSNADAATQTTSHDVRTGVAETLMHAYVNANVGPGAPLARQKAKLTLGTDGVRGPSLTKRARFPVLGNLLHELAVVSDLGFRVVQRGDNLVFETFAVADRTKTIRLDVVNGTLASQAVAVSAPGATRVIVAGQGELVDRTFVARDNAESVEAETAWGRRIERFVDQRQTNDLAELQQAGDELLAEEGFTAVSVKAVPMDDTTMQFGRDWSLGDRVTVVVDDTESTAIVTGFVLRVGTEGVRIGATLGDIADFDPNAALGKRVEDTARRVSELERNATTEGHTHVFPVESVNGRTGAVTGLAEASHTHPEHLDTDHDDRFSQLGHTHPAVDGSWELIERRALSAALAGGLGNLFFSVPAGYKSVRILSPWCRHTGTTSASHIYGRINEDAGSNYGGNLHYHTTGTWSGTYYSTGTFIYVAYNYFYGNSYGGAWLDFEVTSGPRGRWWSKHWNAIGNGGNSNAYGYGSENKGGWHNSAAISRIDLWNSAGYSWEAGSEFLVYGKRG